MFELKWVKSTRTTPVETKKMEKGILFLCLNRSFPFRTWASLEPCKTSKMEYIAKIFNGFFCNIFLESLFSLISG